MIDVGLPTYMAIDRRPESGCEIDISTRGGSGITLRLEVVRSLLEDSLRKNSKNMNGETAVTYGYVNPRMNTDHIVCADSYFGSAETAKKFH